MQDMLVILMATFTNALMDTNRNRHQFVNIIDRSKSHSTTLTSLLALGNNFYYTLFLQCSMANECDLLAAKENFKK